MDEFSLFADVQGDYISFVYPRDYRGSEQTHAFLFQDPSIPLRIADSFLSQEYEF